MHNIGSLSTTPCTDTMWMGSLTHHLGGFFVSLTADNSGQDAAVYRKRKLAIAQQIPQSGADTCSSPCARMRATFTFGIMLGLWTAGREYAVGDLVIFALTAVVGLVVILVIFWFWESPSKVRVLF